MDKLQQFLNDIKQYDYVVQRNWDNLPQSYAVNGHDDLDLFATNYAKARINEILKRYPDILCDVRSEEDDYYPVEIGDMLLNQRIERDGFFIPSKEAAFYALYYHNLVHKNDDPYGGKLKDMFRELFPPVQCKDGGVGYYGIN